MFFLLLMLLAVSPGWVLLEQLFHPDAAKLEPYSFELDRKEPFTTPFIAEFQHGSNILYYLAGHHENDTSTATFDLIRRCFENCEIDAVVLEGIPSAEGYSPERILNTFKKDRSERFYKRGEPGFAAMLADARGIPFIGGEPTHVELRERLLDQGYSGEDILGFYFARQIPSYKRNHTLANKGVKKTFDEFIAVTKSQVGLNDQAFDYQQFLQWFEKHNGQPFNVDTLQNNDLAPLANGKLFTQRMSADVGLIRDEHVLETIAFALEAHKHVLVVYGSSHLATQRRAIEAMVGPPVRQFQKF